MNGKTASKTISNSKTVSNSETVGPILFHLTGEFVFLSNFHILPRPILYKGLEFRSSEHIYQYMKYEHNDGPEYQKYREIIRTCKTPYMAKLLANQRKTNFVWAKDINEHITWAQANRLIEDPKFISKKIDLMYEICLVKFSVEPLKQKLLDTLDRQLVEHSVTDSFWADGADGKGRNMLGHILMKVRKVLGDSQ